MKTYKVILILSFLCNVCFAQVRNIEECKRKIPDSFDIAYVFFDRYIIYGEIDSAYLNKKIEVSSMQIMDCNFGENIIASFFCEENNNYNACLPFHVRLERNDSILKITHYSELPCGKDWGLFDIPVYEQQLLFTKNGVKKISEKCLLIPRKITKGQYDQVMDEYKDLKSKGKNIFNNQDDIGVGGLFIDKLFLCSLNNFKDSKRVFINIKIDFPQILDGIIGDIYDQRLMMLMMCK